MLEQSLIEDGMRRALTLALRGPADDPNPQVGCVLLDGEGRIVAEGWHRGAGSPHAEVAAIAMLPEGRRANGAGLTAVVTLEPCNHTGRTGPCAQALIAAGVGAVAYAVGDPGQRSSGGAATLRAAGIEVRSGVLTGEALALLGPWLARQGAATSSDTSDVERGHSEPQLPRVTVKWAQTLDGRAAATDGSSQWITGAAARRDVHLRRAAADAILVGTGTLLADDPALTARAAGGELLVPADRQPIPVILGTREIPGTARALRHPALAAHGLRSPLQLTGTDLASDLASLHARGIRRLFVEGGPTVASAILAAGLADELLVYVAPALLGGPRLAIGDLGIANIADMRRLGEIHTERLGADLLFRAELAPARTPLAPTTSHEEGP